MNTFKLNTNTRKASWIIAIMWMLSVNTSCKKFAQVPPPDTQIEAVKVFADDKSALSASGSVYAAMSISSLNIASGGMTVYPALSADELVYNSSDPEFLSFQNNAVIADNGQGIYGRMWAPAYKDIYYANSVLEGITNSVTITPGTRDQIMGEMLVVRALNYFCLVNLFGDVPLELTTDYKVNSKMHRTPIDEVYHQLTTDLLKAEGLLKENYPSDMRAKPNKWTAAALLARIYLYQKDWADAEAQASAVINSNQYVLEPDLNNVFSQSSGETIWQLANDNTNTSEAAQFIPYSPQNIPNFAISSFLLSAFEPGDQRLSKWISSDTVDSNVYYYPFKYKDRNYQPVTEFYVVLRLAEQYLIRSEARAQQGNIDGAIEDINVIRSRAGLSDISASDKDSILSAIAHERQVELFCEWGHRWCDLKRTGTVNEILGVRKAPNWQPTDTVYPLPSVELVNNPFLVQNHGY
jgi:hypothetical protein